MAALGSVLEAPLTRASLCASFDRLGVRAGETVLLHSSLRALGWVCGGARSVVLALLDVLGPEGTLVSPAQTPENRDPSRWTDPSVPERWWDSIREHLPAFDPATSSAIAMGAVAEQIRTWPESVRSAHPQTSFSAVGRQAHELMAGHAIDCQLGESSPLAKLEKAQARVLLLGVPMVVTTAFHLAEYRLENPPQASNSCAVRTESGRAWITYEDVALDSSDFEILGKAFATASMTFRSGEVGAASACLFSLAEAVNFAHTWFRENRSTHGNGRSYGE